MIKAVFITLTAIAMMCGCFSCTLHSEKRLPILGRCVVQGTDTLYHTIPDFRFIDQHGDVVTQETYRNQVYVADFFFTSCRTICPVMKTQMLRIYEATENMDNVALLSHTIDPEYDSVELLRDYAYRLGVRDDRWHFVTGDKESIYKIAREGYFTTALEDDNETDGFVHSGAFLLIDKQRRIRGKYDGTDVKQVDQLISDIAILQKEHE